MKRFLGILVVLSCLYSCGEGAKEAENRKQIERAIENNKRAKIEKAIKDSVDREKVGDNYRATEKLRKELSGKKFIAPWSLDFIQKNGSPETLSGTDGKTWVAYFRDGDITVVKDKKTDIITNVIKGYNSQLQLDPSNKLRKMIGKRMTFNKYTETISSIRYGKRTKLSKEHCINNDCVNYYSKGNFTTLEYTEFNDDGDFVTLKKIAQGEVPYLAEY